MRILLIRTSALGDIVHCLPVLRALRRNLPEARIGWVVEKVFSPLLNEHPDLDEVFPVRLRPWRRGLHRSDVRREIGSALREIRAFRADLALDLMGNHKAGLIARLSGAKRIVGAAHDDRREPSSSAWIRETVPLQSVHAVDRGMDLLTPFGFEDRRVDFGPDILLRGDASTESPVHPRPYVLIQAGAGWGNKTWPAAWWGEVAQRIREECGLDVLVPIAPGEEDLAHGVAAASGGAAQAISSRGFHVLAAQIRGAKMLLGGDTGPLHLAHALNIPVLCVMGPTDPDRHGPWEAPEHAVVHRLPCSFCYKRFQEAKACLTAISPQLVAAQAITRLNHLESILDQPSSER